MGKIRQDRFIWKAGHTKKNTSKINFSHKIRQQGGLEGHKCQCLLLTWHLKKNKNEDNNDQLAGLKTDIQQLYVCGVFVLSFLAIFAFIHVHICSIIVSHILLLCTRVVVCTYPTNLLTNDICYYCFYCYYY